MAKAKKNDTTTTDSSKVEARPTGLTKDPLAEGNTLVNPSNTEAETHYEVRQTSEEATKIDGQDANERAEEHNAQSPDASADAVPNADAEEQAVVAEGRTEETANQ